MYKSYKDLPTKTVHNNVYEIVSIDDKNTILSNNKVVCVNIHAEWCGPCKSVAPQIVKLADEYKGKCLIVREDIDRHFTKGVNGVPAFHFFKEGKKVHEITGADIKEIRATLDKLIYI